MGSPPDQTQVTVIGAGLAGCEAAVAMARRGVRVVLLEMKPVAYSPAHALPGPAELVCSNSLKSDDPGTAHGLLKCELRRLGSVILQAADAARVPAGTALAVDRARFSEAVAAILIGQPGCVFRPGTVVGDWPDGEVVLATGPLTQGRLAERLRDAAGGSLHFFDALAPIVSAASIDLQVAFAANRWDQGQGPDYLNCPLSREEYQGFVAALRAAERTPFAPFETEHYFEGCLPIEVMADRGPDTLAFGPMRPVGLRVGGRRPFAVVQLRPENRERTAFNLVGFQTKLTHAAQRETFRRIPGLQRAEFLRFGAVHRNLYLDSPKVLDDGLRLTGLPRVRLAGQITGVEGYVESAAVGLWVGLQVAAERRGQTLPPPPSETALGALLRHLRGGTGAAGFEPMNIHFGLLPAVAGRGKGERREQAITRASRAFEEWVSQAGDFFLPGA